MHAHQGADKFYFVLEGEGKFTVGDEERHATAGALVVAPAGIAHGVTNTSGERLIATGGNRSRTQMSETGKTISSRQSDLGLSTAEIDSLSSQVTRLVTEYFAEVSDLPVFPQTSGGPTIAHLESRLPVAGEPLEKLLADCREIIKGIRHNGHPRQFGYVASPATPAGAFADLIASALNVNVTAWRSAPAATELERMVVRWLGSMIGYSEEAHGLLTSGGSMANLIAMLIAHRTKAKA